MFLLTVLVMTEISHMSLGDDCTLPRLYTCLESLQTLGNTLDKVTTKEQLEGVCRLLKLGVKCVDSHLSSCFTSGQRKVFDDVVFAARLFLEELYVEGPIQAAYLQHSQCYENVSLSDEKCARLYEDLEQLSQTADKETNAKSGLKKTCCAFRRFIDCKYHHVSLNCGSEAADFLHLHLDRISSPLLHELCFRFLEGEDCSLTSSSRPHYTYVMFYHFQLLLICLYMWYK